MTAKSNSAEVGYDSTSRTLHWVMALLFLWIFASAASHYLAVDSWLDMFLWPTHKPTGLLLFALWVVRVCWSVKRLRYRPRSINAAAHAVHLSLYLLMFLVPFIGLLRQYGSGRAFSAFGLSVFEGFSGEKVQWMIDLGTRFHSFLGWILLVLIGAHVAAAITHHVQGNKRVLSRMLGNAEKN